MNLVQGARDTATLHPVAAADIVTTYTQTDSNTTQQSITRAHIGVGS